MKEGELLSTLQFQPQCGASCREEGRDDQEGPKHHGRENPETHAGVQDTLC